MDIQNLEMITCPRCGQPFPKKRKELGYNYCVNCSTEKHVVCIVEDVGEGDHTYDHIVIMKPEEALAINALRNKSKLDYLEESEPEPDMRTTEDQDVIDVNELSSKFENTEEEDILEDIVADNLEEDD